LAEEGEGSHLRRLDAATLNSDIKSNYCRRLYVISRMIQKLLTKDIFWRYFVTEVYFSTHMQECTQKILFCTDGLLLYKEKRQITFGNYQ